MRAQLSKEKAAFPCLGLLFFVGIPIPGSGIWSGSLIASLLDFSVKRAVCAQVMGLILCISIMIIVQSEDSALLLEEKRMTIGVY